jgi:Conserved protein containing a Zn-ribbon-like motif, possibly RNA-binding
LPLPMDRLRICQGPNCSWLFIDRSKAGRRRWCDMAVCGNTAKSRRFYARSRQHRSRKTARSPAWGRQGRRSALTRARPHWRCPNCASTSIWTAWFPRSDERGPIEAWLPESRTRAGQCVSALTSAGPLSHAWNSSSGISALTRAWPGSSNFFIETVSSVLAEKTDEQRCSSEDDKWRVHSLCGGDRENSYNRHKKGFFLHSHRKKPRPWRRISQHAGNRFTAEKFFCNRKRQRRNSPLSAYLFG